MRAEVKNDAVALIFLNEYLERPLFFSIDDVNKLVQDVSALYLAISQCKQRHAPTRSALAPNHEPGLHCLQLQPLMQESQRFVKTVSNYSSYSR